MLNQEVTSAGEIEEILFRLSSFVHHTNNLWIEPEQKLLVKYMKEKRITRPMRERIVQLCSNIIYAICRQSQCKDKEISWTTVLPS